MDPKRLFMSIHGVKTQIGAIWTRFANFHIFLPSFIQEQTLLLVPAAWAQASGVFFRPQDDILGLGPWALEGTGATPLGPLGRNWNGRTGAVE